jgi:membrane protease YdiL (CAAX protease family)
VSWIAYLLAYEFLFRGFLFFAALPVLGLFFAIVLNTIIYALVHLYKGFKEVIWSVPLGILLCYLTYLTGTIWVAVFTHIILALSGEWFSVWAHPDMYFAHKE